MLKKIHALKDFADWLGPSSIPLFDIEIQHTAILLPIEFNSIKQLIHQGHILKGYGHAAATPRMTGEAARKKHQHYYVFTFYRILHISTSAGSTYYYSSSSSTSTSAGSTNYQTYQSTGYWLYN
jgi:hypothetical protein